MRRANHGTYGQLTGLITPVQAQAGHRTHASYVTDLTPKSLRTFAQDSCD
jgi:hypothetical protein